MAMNVELARFNMIEQQVRPWDVLDERVLGVLASLRREDFVPPALRALAFTDMALPLGHDEVMMKPVVEGRVLQALLPVAHESVLEIGTGSGFLTACLARLSASVTSVELHAEFSSAAQARLAQAGIGNVQLEVADAVRNYQPSGAFDVMVVTGAVARLPQHWRGWLKPGGRLFAIQGQSPVQRATLHSESDGQWREIALFETDLPYLRNAAPAPSFAL